ncbi:LON peptidase N-terminal domain and RING finger protein 2-like [Acipenser ruthenus]|uniref:LON peptidase N-terminal domain and RING finger protein 2-like n=1 Tax=Acipenser ruthenus TaxID=7906 RepID=UPI00145AED07|nr:LON peptidase N-terminal domain and RING finger protein 2-like [Acipenser ruthenus]
METGTPNHSQNFLCDFTNPSAPGICPEMLEVAQEAFRAGDYSLAAEIYGSQLADLQHPDRGLCLRKGDALAWAGRIGEALDLYCTAANLGRLRPEELQLLVESLADSLREKELKLSSLERKTTYGNQNNGKSCETSDYVNKSKCSGDGDIEKFGDMDENDESLDLFACRVCKCLLSDPTTLQCGHTFCKRCLENETVTECKICKYKLNKKNGQLYPIGFRVNVILVSLLDKWYETESKARRLYLEGESLCKKQEFGAALENYNTAIQLAPFDYILIGERAKLHTAMNNYTQAVQDGDSICRLKPLWPKAHYLKAIALTKVGRKEEALKEFLFCAALRPEWSSVKLEAQKILCETFSSVFENDSFPAPLRPQSSYTQLKPSLLNCINLPLTDERLSDGCSKDSLFKVSKTAPCDSSMFTTVESVKTPHSLNKLDFPFEDTKTLGSVLSSLPGSSLKRRCPSKSGSSQGFELPCKILKQDGDCFPQKAAVHKGSREVPIHLVDSSDLECSLCMRLFYEPVTTPCGHTFCLKCLERCLDHNPSCPLCKEDLSLYLATKMYNKTFVTEEVIIRYLSEELAERKTVYEEEMKELSNLNKEVPIFVCTIAFPTISCPLHVFEPRYRLMIRRCMETGTKQFGMCIADERKGFADYGCMLEVRDVKFFPDGRSVVDTIGVSRFKVLSHSQRDGYNTANVEYLEDKKTEGEEYAELVRLHNSVYDQAVAWFTSLKDNMKSQILSHFGSMPGKESDPQASPNGPAWCWWLLAVLPLENRAQLTILAMTCLKERLIAIRRVLIFVTRKRSS